MLNEYFVVNFAITFSTMKFLTYIREWLVFDMIRRWFSGKGHHAFEHDEAPGDARSGSLFEYDDSSMEYLDDISESDPCEDDFMDDDW